MRKRDLSAGLSPEQAAAADAGSKAMIPVPKRPFLDYVLSGLADAGYTDVCLVIGPEHSAIREYYQLQSPPARVAISFAIQHQPRGSADALLAAESFAGNDEFLMINSDNYYPQSALGGLRHLGQPGVALFERGALLQASNVDPERIRHYAVCQVTSDGNLKAIVEKPSEAADAADDRALISMNIWRFSRQMFDACRNAPLSSRGEYELPGAVEQSILTTGARYKVFRCSDGVLDLSRRSDIETVTKMLAGIEPQP
jgi:dTDP-glucose pyrophosphorylase